MTVVRRALTLFASLALSLALAAPVSAAASKQGSPPWACSPEDTAAAVGGGGAARGPAVDSQGRVREKDTGQIAKALPANARGKAPPGFSVTVPVYFHVITDGSLGNVSDADVRNQMRVLNGGFSGGAGGTATGFSFVLAGITRTDNPVWYRLQSGGAEHEMKKALKVGGDGTLNVYASSAGGYLGYAYLPEITDTAQRYLDGIVIDWETMVGVSDTWAGVADEGDTLVHEAGHWLNLEHTFFGQCNKTGDFVDDTPPQKWASAGCPIGNDTCPAPGLDPVTNYMDYSDDSCMFQFTPGQVQRMRDAWLFWRAS